MALGRYRTCPRRFRRVDHVNSWIYEGNEVIMKNFKRFAAMASAAVLAACAVAPVGMNVFADNYSITISDNGSVSAKSHKFNAYQIFTGTLSDDEKGFTGGSVAWGSAITDNGAALIAALKEEEFSDATAETAIEALADDSTAYYVALALEKITLADDRNALAAVINSVITNDTDVAGSYNGNGPNATINLNTAGYYFVKDVTELSSPGNDALSRFIIRVLGSETIKIKTDAPSLEKKIWDNDTTASPTIDDGAPTGAWGDVADNQIGDTVYYYIETTVPDMSAYDTYTYIIRDVMSEGLTLNEVTAIKYVSASGTTDLTNASGVTINKKDDTSTSDVTETFYVNFSDLKTTLSSNHITPAPGDKIYTYYNATLNEKALVSDTANSTQNNPNEAWLTYSNNPNQSGSGDNTTGDTPHDKVYDWTYTFEAEKVDEKNQPLAGAKFNLKLGNNVIKLIEITNTTALNGNGILIAPNTRYFRPAKTGETGGVDIIETVDGKNKFMFIGLDDTKEYQLEETEAPNNYTKAKDSAALVISAEYNTTGEAVSAISRTVDGNSANIATIENKKGTALPGTGGIGTTIFYVGGGAMVAVAGIFLITKKRMGKKDK